MYPLPTTDPIVEAAAGWAHCVSVTGTVPTPDISLLTFLFS